MVEVIIYLRNNEKLEISCCKEITIKTNFIETIGKNESMLININDILYLKKREVE